MDYVLKGNVVNLQTYTDINAGSDQLEIGLIDEHGDLLVLNENPRSTYTTASEEVVRKKLDESFFNPKVYKKTTVLGMAYVRPNW